MWRNIHDQETEIRQISAVFAEEKSEDRETKKSRHVQDKDCSEEARTRGSVFQTALSRFKNVVATGLWPVVRITEISKTERPFLLT
jgi:hypothetical protein